LLASPRAAGAATVTRTSSAFTPEKKNIKHNVHDLKKQYMNMQQKALDKTIMMFSSFTILKLLHLFHATIS
jgi:hypothetical protein